MSALRELALHGGKPVFDEGPPQWPLADEDVRAALEACYAQGDWGRYDGPCLEKLAELLAKTHQVTHALPCASGTAAVELALRGLGVGPGDEVILAGYDFPGNFRCIEAVGSFPVLVDINPQTWSIDVKQLAAAVTPATKAMVASHLHGGLVDMVALREIAKEHSLAVVEDACQCPGAEIHGRPAGSWGDAAVLSFGGSKLLTSGRGGAVLTSRDDVRQRIVVYCDRGNHFLPMSQLQSSVLPPQLNKLPARNAKRAENAQRLAQALAHHPAMRPIETMYADSKPSYYKFAVAYDRLACQNVPRETIIAALRAEGVDVGEGFRGFFRRGARRCRKVGELTHCRQAAESTILLHHPVLLENAAVIDRVAGAFEKVAGAFS